METLVPERRMVGGLALRQDGGFIMTGPNVAHWRDGEVRVLLERDGVNSFNDCHTDQQGRLYVGAIRSDLDDLKAAKTSGECYRINLDDEDNQGSIFHTRPVVVGLPTPLAAV